VVFGFDQQHTRVIYSDAGDCLHRCKMVLSKQFTVQLEHTSNPDNVWGGSVANHKLISESTKPFRCEQSVIQNTEHSNVAVLE